MIMEHAAQAHLGTVVDTRPYGAKGLGQAGRSGRAPPTVGVARGRGGIQPPQSRRPGFLNLPRHTDAGTTPGPGVANPLPPKSGRAGPPGHW